MAQVGTGCTGSRSEAGDGLADTADEAHTGTAPWLNLSISGAHGDCEGDGVQVYVTVAGDEPDRVVAALVMTDGSATPPDEVHPMAPAGVTVTGEREFEVKLVPADPGAPVEVGVSSRFVCDLEFTRVVVALDAAGRVADCVAFGGDAAGLFAGQYEAARGSGAFDALGVSSANCKYASGP